MVADAWALVLDGITRYPDDGCVHDVPWFVSGLCAAVAGRVWSGSLIEVLSGSIAEVARSHEGTCDLANPVSPGATVALVRVVGEVLEWLLLGDCAIAWTDQAGAVQVRGDERLAELPNPPAAVDVAGIRRYPVEYVASVRNREGGFWVAATAPEAAAMAYTGEVPVDDIGQMLICTDGLTRLVERYDHTWESMFTRAGADGISGLLKLVRAEEERDPNFGPKSKRHDDATGVFLRFR
ncbi:protein phosphatase 2C domain-containing protein [Glycomyces sp. NPDC046736]|uniref:protein phosphatase 2C domain-containing protein n=1 Tax=Glycomyces sp. NPDC046736 TaxID=3155615 RepID=UPI0033EE950E